MILTVILHGDVRTETVLLPKATGYQTKTQVPGVGYPPFQVVSQGESTWVIPPEYDDRTLLLKIPYFLVKGHGKIKLIKPDSFLPGRKLSWFLKMLCRLMGAKAVILSYETRKLQ